MFRYDLNHASTFLFFKKFSRITFTFLKEKNTEGSEEFQNSNKINKTIVVVIKGTVQRELRGVKIGINQTARINCTVGKCHLPCPKGHHHERSLNVIGGCSTF